MRNVKDMTDDELTVEIASLITGGKPARSRLRASDLPRHPAHLSGPAVREWRRVARLLHDMGVLTAIDRAALAAYCQSYGRWVEAEERLAETPILFKTPAGYVQQSPWLGIANKQLELMGRYMIELGMTPASRSRVAVVARPEPPVSRIVAASPAKAKLESMIDAVAQRMLAGELITPESWLERHGGDQGGD